MEAVGFCPECGRTIDKTFLYCPWCGTLQKRSSSADPLADTLWDGIEKRLRPLSLRRLDSLERRLDLMDQELQHWLEFPSLPSP